MADRAMPTAPFIDTCVEELSWDIFSGAPSLTREAQEKAEELFAIMSYLGEGKKYGYSGSGTTHSIWIKVPRGTPEDYEALAGEKITAEEFARDYPDEYYWSKISTYEYQYDNGPLKTVSVNDTSVFSYGDGKRVFEKKEPAEASTFIVSLLCAVSAALEKIEAGTYYEELCRELPMNYRFGTISRSTLWKADPERRSRDLSGISAEMIRELEEEQVK